MEDDLEQPHSLLDWKSEALPGGSLLLLMIARPPAPGNERQIKECPIALMSDQIRPLAAYLMQLADEREAKQLRGGRRH
jgi:hypothetical protein